MSPQRSTSILLARLTALSIGAVVAIVFFERCPIPLSIATRHIAAFAGVLAVLSAAWVLGSVSIKLGARVCGKTAKPDISTTDCLLVGIPVYGTLIAAIAWSGLAIEILIPSATLLLAVPGMLPLVRSARGAFDRLGDFPSILFPPVAVAAMSALMPLNSPDELIYKLSVPKSWLDWGHMLELPLNSGSYFPASIYSADLGAITLAGGGAARMLHFALFLLALRVVWRLGDDIRLGSGLWATVVFSWTPAILIIAGWAWAEWGLLGLVLLSWHRFMQFVEKDDATAGAIAALALAGAISAKYTAGPWLALFIPIAAVILYRAKGRKAWRYLPSFATIVTSFGGFFYLRNFIWTGSPLAPFGLPNSPAVEGFRSNYGGWWELFHGYDIFFPQMIDDSMGMLLPISVLLSPVVLAFAGRRQLPFFLFGALHTIWLVNFAPTSRLMLLGIAPLVLLGTAAAHAAFQDASKATRLVACTSIGVMLSAQFMLVAFTISTSYEPFKYLVGAETEFQYLSRMRPFTRPYTWIDKKTPPDSVILLLGETHAWHLKRRAHWAGNLDGPRVAAWMGRAKSPAELKQQLDDLGITHILIQKERYQVRKPDSEDLGVLEKEFVLRVSEATDDVLRDMLREHSAQRYEDKLYLIFELEPPARSSPAANPPGPTSVP